MVSLRFVAMEKPGKALYFFCLIIKKKLVGYQIIASVLIVRAFVVKGNDYVTKKVYFVQNAEDFLKINLR